MNPYRVPGEVRPEPPEPNETRRGSCVAVAMAVLCVIAATFFTITVVTVTWLHLIPALILWFLAAVCAGVAREFEG